MTARPTALDITAPGELTIRWEDGQSRIYTFRELRENCPCASCVEKRTAEDDRPPVLLPILSPQETRPLAITGMQPVGSYAYLIHFSDGHDTGIYPLELLRELGRDM